VKLWGIGAAVALAVVATGPLTGWVWYLTSPRYTVERVDGGYVYLDAQPVAVVGAEVYFAIIGLVAGFVTATLVWGFLRRWRGLEVLVGLTVGSLASGYVAWKFGVWLGGGEFAAVVNAAAAGELVTAPLRLRMTSGGLPDGVVAIPAFAAALLYTAFAGFSPFADLRPTDDLRPTEDDADQLGPGRSGSSETGTGTALT
jgi:hypothetical protein